ncbi:hypothetical protein C0W59_07610 [Photobacterium kishitanii]|uniref:hypothetical protein n=1 Tax=Photobacterium kishitanii TaxID=318456 RepID=UPI000D178C9C|nr:hypothetical protein [Photobacterium kishitanii]PSV16545.1 hypothetical protein C0W59_07610 [Photobacterium kishitanii]
MTEYLDLSIPVVINMEMDEDAIRRVIVDAIMTCEEDFIPKMSAVCLLYDARADYNYASLSVDEVNLDVINTDDDDELILDIEGSVSVMYDWSAHYGCRDMSHDGEVSEVWDFNFQQNSLIFHLDLPPERVDEI